MMATEGILYPLSWLTIIKQLSTKAELKILSVIYGYSSIVGVDATPLSFTDIKNLTGLSKRSTREGIDRLIREKYIKGLNVSGQIFYQGLENSPHDHVHDKYVVSSNGQSNAISEHDHAEKSIRQEIWDILCQEFGMAISLHVVNNLVWSGRYSVDELWDQIRYTRWEVMHGLKDGQRVTNPAGRLVYRLRTKRTGPKGFDLQEQLTTDMGWTQTQLYQAIYDGLVKLPSVEESISYHSWLRYDQGSDNES